jgi:hypothetical protein
MFEPHSGFLQISIAILIWSLIVEPWAGICREILNELWICENWAGVLQICIAILIELCVIRVVLSFFGGTFVRNVLLYHLLKFGAILKPCWVIFGKFRGHLESMLGHLEVSMGRLLCPKRRRTNRYMLLGVLGRSSDHLAAILCHLA